MGATVANTAIGVLPTISQKQRWFVFRCWRSGLLGVTPDSARETHAIPKSRKGRIKWCPRQDLNLYDVTH